LYDQGFKNIVNVDFSEPVIASMLEQNLSTRPDMEWTVMDMTNLTFDNESFDVVLDKGALDALMSNDSVESRSQASSMFDSITRVLRDGGRYICVTLAERFILEHVLTHFINNTSSSSSSPARFHVQMEVFESSSSKSSPSPFLPFVLVITKNPTSPTAGSLPGHVTAMFDNFGATIPLQQHAKRLAMDALLPLVSGLVLCMSGYTLIQRCSIV
jgi:ubiquinone/menaquinone biosynthesis C-methylase UbiE